MSTIEKDVGTHNADPTALRQDYRFCLALQQQMSDFPDVDIAPEIRQAFRDAKRRVHGHIDKVIAQLRAQEPVFEPLTSRWTVGKTNGVVLQQATWHVMQGLMEKPLLDGRSPSDRDLVLIAIRAESLIDMIGCDFLLINQRTGQFTVIDCSLREKSADGLCRLRQQGVVIDPMFGMNLYNHGLASALYSLEQTICSKFIWLCKQTSQSILSVVDLRLPFSTLAGNLHKQALKIASRKSQERRLTEAGLLSKQLTDGYDAIVAFIQDLSDLCQLLFDQGRYDESYLIAEFANQISTGKATIKTDVDAQGGALYYLAAALATLQSRTASEVRAAPRLHRQIKLRKSRRA